MASYTFILSSEMLALNLILHSTFLSNVPVSMSAYCLLDVTFPRERIPFHIVSGRN